MTSLKPRPPRTGSVMFYNDLSLSEPFDLNNMKECPVTEDMLILVSTVVKSVSSKGHI